MAVVLRVKDARKDWRVRGVQLGSWTVLDLKAAVKKALNLFYEAPTVKLSSAAGFHTTPYREAVDEWPDATPLSTTGLKRGSWLYVTYPSTDEDLAPAPLAGAAPAAAPAAAAVSGVVAAPAPPPVASGSVAPPPRVDADTGASAVPPAALPYGVVPPPYPASGGPDTAAPSATGTASGAAAGGSWPYARSWPEDWRENCPVCAADHTKPEIVIRSLADLTRSLERRHMLGIYLVGPTGTRTSWEFCDKATVGDLRDCLSKEFRLTPQQTGLIHVGGRANSFDRDDAKLVGDVQGPELAREPRVTVETRSPSAGAGTTARASASSASGARRRRRRATPSGAGAGGAAGAGAGAGAGGAGAGAGAGAADVAAAAGGIPVAAASTAASTTALAAADDGGAADPGSMLFDRAAFKLGAGREPIPAHVRTIKELQEYLHDKYETIIFNTRAAVRSIRFDSNPFMNQHLQRRRFAWLLGTVTHDRHVEVEAIYEPPQIGFRDHFLLKKDPQAELVATLCENLGLKRVGWLTNHKYRGQTPMTAAEMLFHAKYQAENPDFVMIKLAKDQADGAEGEAAAQFLEFTAYQVSPQCVEMYGKGLLRTDPQDPFRLYSTRKVECVNPDNGRFEFTNKFDNEWMTALVGITERRSSFTHYFPVPNRVDVNGLPLPEVHKDHLDFLFRQEFAVDGFLERLADFNFLLYVAGHKGHLGFSESEVKEMCTIVKSADLEGAETFRAKVEAVVGLGYQCPVCQRKGVDGGFYDSVVLLAEHVRTTESHKHHVAGVVCPVCAELAPTRERRTKTIRGSFADHMKHLHTSDGRPHSERDAHALAARLLSELGRARPTAASAPPRRPAVVEEAKVRGLSSDEDEAGDDLAARPDRSRSPYGLRRRAAAAAPAPAAVPPPAAEPSASAAGGSSELDQLVSFGFSRSSAQRALACSYRGLEGAIDLLGAGAECPFGECKEIFVSTSKQRDLEEHVNTVHGL